MPFKSKRQLRYMFSAEARGELPPGTAVRWVKHTRNVKALPETAPRMLKKAYQIAKLEGMKHLLLGRGSTIFPLLTGGAMGAAIAPEGKKQKGALVGAITGLVGAKVFPAYVAKPWGIFDNIHTPENIERLRKLIPLAGRGTEKGIAKAFKQGLLRDIELPILRSEITRYNVQRALMNGVLGLALGGASVAFPLTYQQYFGPTPPPKTPDTEYDPANHYVGLAP